MVHLHADVDHVRLRFPIKTGGMRSQLVHSDDRGVSSTPVTRPLLVILFRTYARHTGPAPEGAMSDSVVRFGHAAKQHF